MAKARSFAAPCLSLRVAHRGACGKTRWVPRNCRPAARRARHERRRHHHVRHRPRVRSDRAPPIRRAGLRGGSRQGDGDPAGIRRCRTTSGVAHFCKQVLAIVSEGGATSEAWHRSTSAISVSTCGSSGAPRSCRLRQLAEAAGVSNPYLSQIERGLRKPSAEILQQVAKALRISAETLYVQAGILDAAGAGRAGDARRHPRRTRRSTSGRSRCCSRSTSPSARRTPPRRGARRPRTATSDGPDADRRTQRTRRRPDGRGAVRRRHGRNRQHGHHR